MRMGEWDSKRIPADLSCGPIITIDVTAKVIGLCHLFVMKIRLR